jgi:uncharacterized RDD family membrane protein YckC
VAVAVGESDLERAGELLSGYRFNFNISPEDSDLPPREGQIRIELGKVLPQGLRGVAMFGTAALYFTFFACGKRHSTLGKRLLRLEVRRLDGKALSCWESFERFGGYLASIGTLGIGLVDLWKDPNRRLAHDRIVNTVVLKRERPEAGDRRISAEPRSGEESG